MDIRGSLCALATPFAADGSLDLPAYGRLIDYQLAGGTQGLVVAGSTGEAHMLDASEFDRLVAFAVKHVAGRVPVIVGAGDAATAKTVAAVRHVASLGADAALVVAPYYVRPTQEGMRRHYLEVAEHAGLPIVLYNVPSRTACDMLPETVAQLVDHPLIVGVKEACGDDARIHALAKLVRPGFVFLSGDDYSAARAMLAGAAGTISVVANLVPKAFRAFCDAATAHDAAATARCGDALAPLLKALTCAPNPIAVKAGLPELGLGAATPRLPLVELAEGSERIRIRETLAQLAPRRRAA